MSKHYNLSIGSAGGDGVSGTWADGNVLTITRAAGGFGANGPTFHIEYFNGASHGTLLSASNSIFTPNPASPGAATYNTSYSMTKGSSILFAPDYSSGKEGLHWILDTLPHHTEWFCFWIWRVEPDMLFVGAPTGATPNSAASLADKYGNNSPSRNFKLMWPQHTGPGSSNPDMVSPVIYQTTFSYGGNGLTWFTEWEPVIDYFDIFDWNCQVIAAKADVIDPDVNNGYTAREIWSARVQSELSLPHWRLASDNYPVFDTTSDPDYFYRTYINGWCEEGSAGDGTNIGTMLDFYYYAYGPYSNARVVVTDNATYANSTKIAMQPVRNADSSSYWADDEIQVDCNAQSNITGTKHFHVFPAGYPEGTPVYAGTL